MTNPAEPGSVLADLFRVRRPSVLPLEESALRSDDAAPVPGGPSGPPVVDLDSVMVDPTNPHLGILTTWRLTGSEHWAELPESALLIQDPISPHLGILPTLST